MPMPKPKKDESKEDFISRCMSDENMKNEFDDNDQRLAVCHDLWDKEKKEDESNDLNQAIPSNIEKRSYPVEEFRVIDEDGSPKITGYAAVFNKLSELMWGFQEKVAPGAFKNALKKSDTRALFNHDPNIILGRTSAKTLELKEDKQGLHMTVTPPDTNYVRDVVLTPIKRGDIKEQSFAFTVKKDSWEEDKEKQIVTRTIMEIEELYDVSPVTFPAYADTTVAVRSMEEWRKAAVGSQPPDSGATPGDGIPGDGAIPDGWEKVTSEDVTDGLRRLHIIKTKLKRMEVLEL